MQPIIQTEELSKEYQRGQRGDQRTVAGLPHENCCDLQANFSAVKYGEILGSALDQPRR